MLDTDSKQLLKTFGARVRELRKSKDMSQELLADECKLDRTYIGGVERGERNISLANILKIAVALDIDIVELFHFQKSKSAKK